MRTTDTGEFGDDFFKMFTRHPSHIELTLKDGRVVAGDAWMLFQRHLVLDGHPVRYGSIKSFTAQVDLGFPFGQYLTHPNSDPSWSDWWEQHNRLEWFIARLRAEDIVKLVIGKETSHDANVSTLVKGRIESLTVSYITVVGGVRLPRAEVDLVCHKLSKS